MRSTMNIHLDKSEQYDVTVKRSLHGDVSLNMGDLSIFCPPEKALKIAADILQGVLALSSEQENADVDDDVPCPF